MKHKSSNELFEYWNKVRNGRFAPNRFDIEPVKLADILPDVFILECPDISTYRFRLAGTRICSTLGHEMRGKNLLDYWNGDDREAVHNLLHNVASDGAGALLEFECSNGDRERAVFEMLVLPLVHTGERVNRMLGSVGTLTRPYWTGTLELHHLKLISFDLIWPDTRPTMHEVLAEPPAVLTEALSSRTSDPRRRFRVLEGGLSRRPD
jgi:hypothetical protein